MTWGIWCSLAAAATSIKVQTSLESFLKRDRSRRYCILGEIDGRTIFTFEGVRVTGLTALGRATVHVSSLNDARRVELRAQAMRRSALP